MMGSPVASNSTLPHEHTASAASFAVSAMGCLRPFLSPSRGYPQHHHTEADLKDNWRVRTSTPPVRGLGNFREPPTGEVRRTTLPRTRVNKGPLVRLPAPRS